MQSKENCPTIAFEVTVDCNRCILSVTPGHQGPCNDKTIVLFYGFVQHIKNKVI